MDNEKPIEETLDFSKPDFQFIPKGSHQWKQQGYYIICKSCDLDHAAFIGAFKIMVGISPEGLPILKSRAELGMR